MAENVLTLSELHAFVEKNVPAPQHPLKPIDLNKSSYGYYISPDIIPTDVKLRALLGRRLIRNGQYQQAINWFDIPDHRQAAQKLADLMAIAKIKISLINNAPGAIQTARLLRFSGIELVAYEMYPDNAISSGQYSALFEYRNNDQWISRKEKQRIRHAIPTADDHFCITAGRLRNGPDNLPIYFTLKPRLGLPCYAMLQVGSDIVIQKPVH